MQEERKSEAACGFDSESRSAHWAGLKTRPTNDEGIRSRVGRVFRPALPRSISIRIEKVGSGHHHDKRLQRVEHFDRAFLRFEHLGQTAIHVRTLVQTAAPQDDGSIWLTSGIPDRKADGGVPARASVVSQQARNAGRMVRSVVSASMRSQARPSSGRGTSAPYP